MALGCKGSMRVTALDVQHGIPQCAQQVNKHAGLSSLALHLHECELGKHLYELQGLSQGVAISNGTMAILANVASRGKKDSIC